MRALQPQCIGRGFSGPRPLRDQAMPGHPHPSSPSGAAPQAGKKDPLTLSASNEPESFSGDCSDQPLFLTVVADRLPENGYFRAKVAQENLIKVSKIPYTILRLTQFFEFIDG